MAISDMRRQYSKGSLRESDITSSPFIMFDKWLKDAIDAGIPDPTAMTVATVDANGQPSQRIVLLKDVSEKGFVFFTNLGSRKAQELAVNPKCRATFPGFVWSVRFAYVAALKSFLFLRMLLISFRDRKTVS